MNIGFPEKTYTETIIILMIAINSFLGKPEYNQPDFTPDDMTIAKLFTVLTTNQYKPEKWFAVGKAQDPPGKIKEVRPIPVPGEDYRLLLVTSAIGKQDDRISLSNAGILYEDPFYALLGAFNVGQFKQPYLLPRVEINDMAWFQRNEIIRLLVNKEYKPETYFELCTLRPGPGVPVQFCIIKGARLINFRGIGYGVVAMESPKGSAFYSLYSYQFKDPGLLNP
jgi:hypothetical protein